MIVAEALSRSFGDKPAVRNLSFHVKRGEVMGLLGPNGAGKSTTMKMLTCYLPPSSGTATVGGHAIDEESIAVRRIIGYLPENAPMYADLHVSTHLRFIGRMHGLPEGRLAERMRLMRQVCGLEGVMGRRIGELSKGYRQRVGLAAAMLHDPDCLILDEPTTGLDPNQILDIRRLIRDLGREKTVLLSSHVLSEVEAVCDRVMIIDRGRLVESGTAAELARRVQGGAEVRLVLRGDAEAFAASLRKHLAEARCEAGEGREMAEGEKVAAGGEGGTDETRLRLFHPDREAPLAESAFRAAVEAGAVLLEMRRGQASLEDVFHRLTQGAAADDREDES